MNRRRGMSYQFSAKGCKPLLAVGLLLALVGCGEKPGMPHPPQSPPRPVTSVAKYVSTAQLDLPMRPVMPRPGPM